MVEWRGKKKEPARSYVTQLALSSGCCLYDPRRPWNCCLKSILAPTKAEERGEQLSLAPETTAWSFSPWTSMLPVHECQAHRHGVPTHNVTQRPEDRKAGHGQHTCGNWPAPHRTHRAGIRKRWGPNLWSDLQVVSHTHAVGKKDDFLPFSTLSVFLSFSWTYICVTGSHWQCFHEIWVLEIRKKKSPPKCKPRSHNNLFLKISLTQKRNLY